MKKIKILCSALAAAAFLTAATSCDLEIDESLGEAGTSYTETGCTLTNGKYELDAVIAENSSFAFASGTFDTTDGVSVSFQVQDSIDSDWDNVVTTLNTIIRFATMDYTPNGTYSCNIYEQTDETDASWNAMLNKAGFVTLSFNGDGTICWYMDGVLIFKALAATTFNSSAWTVQDQAEAFIEDVCNGGFTLNVVTKNLVVTTAVDATGAAALYTANQAKN